MRRLLYISILFMLSFAGIAQVVSPLGYGIEGEALDISAHSSGVAVASVDTDSQIQVDVWNGDFWFRLPQPPLPKLGANAYGMLVLKDIKSIQGDIYLVAEHTLDLAPDAPNYILQWTGSEWTDHSDSVVNNALVLHEILDLKGDIELVGIFSGDTAYHNVLKLDGSSWEYQGNLITRNINTDKFSSSITLHEKSYVTGSFTSPSVGIVSMVEWDGNVWQNTAFPPFLSTNNTIGIYNDELVVYGSNSFNTEQIKVQMGTSWQDISEGLENYTVNNIKAFAESQGKLYAIGDIEDANNSSVELLEYNGESWKELDLNVENINTLGSNDEQLFIGGAFSDGKRINGVGELSQHAMIVASVYHDKDGDCIKDQDEEYISNYPLVLDQEIELLLSDKNGMLHVPALEGQHSLNASSIRSWESTCSDINISIDELAVFEGYELGVKQQSGIVDASSWLTDNQSYTHQNGQQKRVLVCARNLGSADLEDAVLELNHDQSITNFSSERPYDSYQSGKASWTLDLQAESKLCFYVDFETDIDQEFEISTALITASGQTDVDQSNNNSRIKYKTGSTLVNEKHCNNGEFISEDEEFMNYKIGFKNLGTSTALEVKIVDVLDDKIVPSVKGMEYLHSHDCKSLPAQYTILANGNWQYKFIWEYKDIDLDNSTGSESEGFLDFKVYLQDNTLVKGESICNQAKIFYSYKEGTFNEPIITNTVCSQIGGSARTPVLTAPADVLKISPMPAQEYFQLENQGVEHLSILMVNAIGQVVAEFQLNAMESIRVESSEYESGVYFLKVNESFTKKLILN